jgi:hypothetical protein
VDEETPKSAVLTKSSPVQVSREGFLKYLIENPMNKGTPIDRRMLLP